MKKKTKFILPAAVLTFGVGAFALTGEFTEGTQAYKAYETSDSYKTGDSYKSNKENVKSQKQDKTEAEGKITAISKDSITIEVPFQGAKTFSIDENTKIKKKGLQKLEKGALAEVDARGSQAYKIDSEKSIEANGILINVSEQDITVEQNGKQETFKKAADFHIDADGHSGALERLRSEVKLNGKFEVKELEIDEDDEDGDED